METGTGKTLVYLKTIYELYRQYAFTKFIILVPSVAIKEGVLSSFEVLNVAEQNEEATLRVELVEVKTYQDGKPPRAKLRLWYAKKDGSFNLKASPFLKVGDDLEEITGHVGYRGYVIRRIFKPLREKTYRCEFEKGLRPRSCGTCVNSTKRIVIDSREFSSHWGKNQESRTFSPHWVAN